MHISILERRKLKAGALALALTAPIAGFESVSKAAVTNFEDVVVEQVGDGSATLGNGSTAVFLDIYSPIVNPVTGAVTFAPEATPQIALPTFTGSGLATNPLTTSGTATSEGEITVSSDGSTILVPGYDSITGVTAIAASNSTTVPREVGLVSTGNGAIDTSTTTTAFNGNNIRSAVLASSTTIYADGAVAPGVTAITVDANATTNGTGTQLQNASANVRQLQLIAGNLYATTGSGNTLRLSLISGFTGTANSATNTELSGLSAQNAASSSGALLGAPYGFAFANGVNTLYVADQGGGNGTANNPTVAPAIDKFTLSGGIYTASGSVSISNGVTGLTTETLTGPSGPFQAVFATTPGEIYEISDTGGSLTGDTLNPEQAVGANEGFRGIVAVPEPASISVLALGGIALLGRRKRRQNALSTESQK